MHVLTLVVACLVDTEHNFKSKIFVIQFFQVKAFFKNTKNTQYNIFSSFNL
jgi:hypothetical protein